jgi:hypothetical protein
VIEKPSRDASRPREVVDRHLVVGVRAEELRPEGDELPAPRVDVESRTGALTDDDGTASGHEEAV